jgi:hypothetical protein
MSKALRGLLKPKNKLSKIHLAVYIVILAIVGAIILIHSFAAPNPNLPGDLNNDNTVNASDLSILLADYNTTNSAADINGDGKVNILDMSILLAHYGQSVSGGGGITPSITGRWYALNSAFNTTIPTNPPISPNSTSMIQNNSNWVLPSSSPYKQWLGPRQRYALSIQSSSELPTVPVKVDWNDSTGSLQCSAKIVNTPIPSSWSSLFGSFSSDADFDASFAIVSPDGTEWDSWKTTAPGIQPYDSACPPDSSWHSVRDDVTNAITGLGYCLTTDTTCKLAHPSASRIWNGGGLIMPQDTKTGQPYPHTLYLEGYGYCTAGQPNPRYVPPARAGDGRGTGTSCIPTGARIQLDPSINVSAWPSVTALPAGEQAWMVPLLKTMQNYGLIPADSTSGAGAGGIGATWKASVAPYVYPWDSAGQGWGYGNGIPYDLMSHFRVIDWTKWTGVQ